MRFASSLFLSLVFALTAGPPAAAQLAQAPAVQGYALSAVVIAGDIGIVQFGSTAVFVVPADKAEALSDYTPAGAATLHFTWLSDGIEVRVDVHQQAAETSSKFTARAAKLVEDVKKAFPPDPPPHN